MAISFTTDVPTHVWYRIAAADGSDVNYDEGGYTAGSWQNHLFNPGAQTKELVPGTTYVVTVALLADNGASTSFVRNVTTPTE